MIQKNTILVICFVILASTISLFPPYSWDVELLKNVRDWQKRQRIIRYFENKIPFKEYDFVFSNIKKEFNIGDKKVTLERHLIFPELIIELFLALLFSVVAQLLYDYSKRFLYYFIMISSLIIGIIILLLNYYYFASWFQPNYSVVEYEKEKIKNVYSPYLEKYSVDEMILFYNQLDRGYQNDWNSTTSKFWNTVNTSVKVEHNKLPPIEKFLVKKEKLGDGLTFLSTLFQDDIEKEFIVYKNYSPPHGYVVNYYLLKNEIDKIKFNNFINSKVGIIKYLKIKKQYFDDYKFYWNITAPNSKKYVLISYLILVLLFFILSRKRILLTPKME